MNRRIPASSARALPSHPPDDRRPAGALPCARAQAPRRTARARPSPTPAPRRARARHPDRGGAGRRSARGAAARPAPAPCDPTKGDVCLNAEQQEQHRDRTTSSCRGLRRPAVRRRAHPGRPARHLHRDRQPDGTTHPPRRGAPGNVVFMRGEERLSGDKLEMDLDTGKGTFENAHRLRRRPGVLVEAKKIERVDAAHLQDRGRQVHLLHASRTRAGASAPPPRRSRWTTRSGHERGLPGEGRARLLPARTSSTRSRRTSARRASCSRTSGSRRPRGFNIGTGFFWAMGRSLDQTFYLDYFTRVRLRLRPRVPLRAADALARELPHLPSRRDRGGGWEHDFNWTAVQMLPGQVRANLQRAGDEHHRVPGADPGQPRPRLAAARCGPRCRCSAASAAPTSQLQADSIDTFFAERRDRSQVDAAPPAAR